MSRSIKLKASIIVRIPDLLKVAAKPCWCNNI